MGRSKLAVVLFLALGAIAAPVFARHGNDQGQNNNDQGQDHKGKTGVPEMSAAGLPSIAAILVRGTLLLTTRRKHEKPSA
jgi:hypothetical protein